MNVLLCHNFYQHAGGEDVSFADEGRMLESHGHTVIRYTRHNDDVRGMGRLQLAKQTLWSRRTYEEVRRVVRQRRIDVVHCNNTFPLISPSVYAAARAEGAAVVQSLRNYRIICPAAQLMRNGRVCEDCVGRAVPWPGVLHGCYRGSRLGTAVVAGMAALHKALGTWNQAVDQYIALTEFSRSRFVAAGFPAERIAVKPNMVDPDPGLGTGGGDSLLFVGRLSPEKGVDALLAAWSLLKEPVPLLIAGDGPLADQVKVAAARDSRIQWLGQRPWDEVLGLMHTARGLVMPSVWYETFGRTVVEAFATGTPVIASRLGAMEELVEHGRTGLLFEAGNPQALADCVRRLIGSPPLAAAMREAARQEYLTRYTAAANYPQLLAIYERAIERRHSEGRPECHTTAAGACQ